jgi:type I restriction enzyme M protein
VATDLQNFSRTLFAAADQLWTNSTLRPDQYAQPVLALIALRQMEAKFEAVHAELAPQYKGRLKPAPADYQALVRCPQPISNPGFGEYELRTFRIGFDLLP